MRISSRWETAADSSHNPLSQRPEQGLGGPYAAQLLTWAGMGISRMSAAASPDHMTGWQQDSDAGNKDSGIWTQGSTSCLWCAMLQHLLDMQ